MSNTEFVPHSKNCRESGVKTFFVQCGKASLYLLLYLGTQVFVSLVVSLLIIVTMQYMTPQTAQGMSTEAFSLSDITLLISVISNALTLLILFIIFAVRKKNFFEETHIKKVPWISVIPIILFGLGFNLLTSVAMSVLPIQESVMKEYEQASSGIVGGNPVFMILGACIFAPVAEEVIFRGLILTRLKNGMPTVCAVLLSSFIFGAIHGQILWACYAFVLGVVLSVIFLRFKSIVANILLHAAYNTTSTVLTLLNLESFDGGLEIAFTVTAIVLSASMAVVLWGMTRMKTGSAES